MVFICLPQLHPMCKRKSRKRAFISHLRPKPLKISFHPSCSQIYCPVVQNMQIGFDNVSRRIEFRDAVNVLHIICLFLLILKSASMQLQCSRHFPFISVGYLLRFGDFSHFFFNRFCLFSFARVVILVDKLKKFVGSKKRLFFLCHTGWWTRAVCACVKQLLTYI